MYLLIDLFDVLGEHHLPIAMFSLAHAGSLAGCNSQREDVHFGLDPCDC